MNLKSLFAKLNETSRTATESAAALCLSEQHYDVEVEHLLLQLLDAGDTDLAPILRHYDVVAERLQAQLVTALGTFKKGNTRTPALSPHITRMIEQAWLLASIEYGVAQVRSAHLLQALLDDAELHRVVVASAPELEKINPDDLRLNLAALVEGSAESRHASALAGPAAPAPATGKAGGKTPALDQYTVNLTQSAREGRIDPVLGREFEVRQMVDILTRRRQNNPILTGEAGVGKTAVVEGLALRIAQGDVPAVLKDVALHTLDLGLLQAGAGVKGEFENRLKAVIEEVKRSLHPIILFIDEAHTLIGSGGQAGQNDAANLLKPALARGELRTIAATTWAEYKKYFEKDAALARRFQVVKVEEPDEDKAIHMLRGLLGKMREHHKVAVMDEALVQAVRLSNRYITGRQLPDKAVSVLDTACARIALAQTSQPGALEDCRRQIDNLQAEISVLGDEAGKGHDHARRLGELQAALQAAQLQEQQLNTQWQQELALVEQLKALSAASEADPAQLNALRSELARVQGDQPLVHALVDSGAIAQVISGWTGIPLGKMLRDEIDTVQRLPELLSQRVLGQDHALHEIGKRIKISRARMEDPNKPIGVFLLLGPSGVGKTETALALADTLYGGERNLITINMSEYQEAHTVSSLKGSPPGYVGYGEGGVLTEAVRRKPYSVVLLDEVEKAHPDVLELFFQVFDKGVLDDGEGREINFRNTVIILTSNTGTEHIMHTCLNAEQQPTPAAIIEGLRGELNQVFKPAFLGRLSIVPFYPVQDQVLERIVALKLERIAKRFARNHQAELSYEPALVKAIAARCTEVDSGARNIDNILSQTLMPELAQRVLERMAQGTPIERLVIELGSDGDFAYRLA
ncbi:MULTISPECIES: type VI secretion system ATPase TssH [Pseudomonas]|uniref:Type VI secretion system ATPase TssH n=1 Tax=Pseudomonas juntendi TaxID=2666183 RepID=A0A7W2JKR1_9PSED|nr:MULTISPECIES: type VI secretion system ATPase TssH [Pseudomonas]OAK61094.1 ClpV1 family T6SS ATPase [Pseudomonas putida]PPB16557.1 type VI secretion system ATPase TssH [Pseudomonas aeruginosa]MBA6060745.1 type VI secretion system ATPase TssH [Pseudomonas juntendi]MBA6127887.1 type VI secretion system ATPase TssH [Pseudomonas juntendi]MBA6144171.1 type VI secretion system ATPase TssH [Pseudomonas juntendi]